MTKSTENVDRIFYDHLWAADWKYVQAGGPLTHTRYRLIDKALRKYTKLSGTCLDLGCGNGALLSILSRSYPLLTLHGIDISENATRNADPKLTASIRTGDIIELAQSFESNSFNTIICSEVLEHVSDPAIVLRDAYRILKPDGYMVITVPAGMEHWSIQDEYAGHLRRFDIPSLRELLLRSGLYPVEIYRWGRLFARLYNQMVSKVGPKVIASCGANPVAKLAAIVFQFLFLADDLIRNSHGFQLVAVARKPLADTD